ncbi:hypothetical protein RB195_013651 [Necator americanus]|uniref:Uncharacterized protein n=1 Tax=Necator americanus TaxID=51031 RepID=A0ABR1DWY1_NECAM
MAGECGAIDEVQRRWRWRPPACAAVESNFKWPLPSVRVMASNRVAVPYEITISIASTQLNDPVQRRGTAEAVALSAITSRLLVQMQNFSDYRISPTPRLGPEIGLAWRLLDS